MPKAPHKSMVVTFRLNAVHPEELSAINIIQGWKDEGIGARAVMVDAINRSKGIRPEVFIHERDSQEDRYIELTEKVFSQFAEQLMEELRRGGLSIKPQTSSDDDGEGTTTDFARAFVRGLNQRNQQATGRDEE